MKWKKSLFVAISSAALLGLVACGNGSSASNSGGESTVWEEVQEEGTMQVGISGTLFPSNYHGDDNELTGYEVEMMNEVGSRLGVDIEYVEMGVDGILTSVQNGQVDAAVNSLQITENRQEDFNFSTPVMYSFGGAVVRESDNSGIESLEDWEGKKAAGGATTTYMQIAEQLGAEPVVYDNATNDVYFRDVASGRTDFIPNDYYVSNTAVQNFSDLGVKMADVRYNPTEIGIVFSNQDNSLKEQVDPIIEEMQQDGTLTQLSEEFYMGEDVSQPVEGVEDMPVIDIENEE